MWKQNWRKQQYCQICCTYVISKALLVGKMTCYVGLSHTILRNWCRKFRYLFSGTFCRTVNTCISLAKLVGWQYTAACIVGCLSWLPCLLESMGVSQQCVIGNCDDCVKQKISVINETKWDEILSKPNFRTKKTFMEYSELLLKLWTKVAQL